MNKFIKNFYNGILIGVSVITPGLSGGTTALILGVYDKIVLYASKLTNSPIKSALFLLPFALGGTSGIVLCSYPMRFLLAKYGLQVNFFVLGVVLGSIPIFLPKTKTPIIKTILLIALGAVPVVLQNKLRTSPFLDGFIYDIIIAFLCAIALILPGISLTNILIVFGEYDVLIKSITDLNYFYLARFVGLTGIATFICIKIINRLYSNYKQEINLIMLGMIIFSSFELVKVMPQGKNIVVCLILFALGASATFLFGRIKE